MAEYIERETAKKQLAEYGYSTACGLLDYIPTADVVSASVFRDCRNELCLKCGAYTQKHNGACDGCRWRQT